MLEKGSGLATWALSEPPDSEGPIAAQALAEHRLAYLDYEGPIAGGRGSVTRWDDGTYELRQDEPDELIAVLVGRRVMGLVTLRRSAADPSQWIFALAPAVKQNGGGR